MKFSECLKLARQQKGLSQKQLAQLLNVPVSTINRYENDNTEPRISTVIEIAEILNMSIDELLRLPCGSNGFPLSPVTNEEHAEMAHAYNFLTQKFFNVEFKDDKYYITTKKSISSSIFAKNIKANRTIVLTKKEFIRFLNTVDTTLEGILRQYVALVHLRFYFDFQKINYYVKKGILPENIWDLLKINKSLFTEFHDFE